jgi:nucleotide-binding universal stress UspA family protein
MSEPLDVLVPLDGSAGAESVLPDLVPLFRKRHGRVTFLRLVERPGELAPARAALDRLAAPVAARGVEVAVRVDVGPAAEGILSAAREGRHGLVAMGTHGRKRTLLGRVADEVLRGCPLPVLLSHVEGRVGDWTRILVPLDGTAAAEEILPEAVAFARPSGATLHLLRVVLPLVVDEGYRGVHFETPRPDARPYLEGVADRLVREGFLAVAETREGMAPAEIVRAARDHDAGLVVMATEAPSAARSWTGKSTALEVIRTAPCPVLVKPLIRSGVRGS